MKTNKFINILAGCALLLSPVATWAQKPQLWYDKPADEWMKSVPIGNGRIGAMVYGDTEHETVNLNESSVWAGEYDPNQEIPFGRERLNALRELFFAGKIEEGNGIASDSLHGTPHSFGTHLPIGDLKIDFKYDDPSAEITDYRRVLDMENALATVKFKKGKTEYYREYLSSNPQDAVVMRFTASKKNAVSFEMHIDMLRENTAIRTENGQIVFEGQALYPNLGTGGVHFSGRVAVKTEGGKVENLGDKIKVSDADAVTIISDVRTDFKNPNYKKTCSDNIKKVLNHEYSHIRKEHIEDYAPLFARVKLQIGDPKRDLIPTDERWRELREGKDDAGLQAQFFQLARYLLIASSRENSPLPVALQGFFNDNLACHMCWTSDYHLDINIQQNYWIANIGNLAECNAPLYTYIADLAHHGAKTAQTVYGCKGWTAHTTANIWGFTAPSGGIGWGLFPCAGSWIATHLWTQYEYTQDKDYLRKVAYPLLKSNAEFLLDYMCEDPNTGYLVTGPSISPENAFGHNGGVWCASIMPTCDRVLVYEILNACLHSTNILGIDASFADSLRLAIAKLPPLRKNKYGGIREWMEDYDDVNVNHRHTSHLLALYPYSQISLEHTPELAEAARNSIVRRMTAHDWEDTEWSRANAICYYARLQDPKEAYESINILMKNLARENLLSISPKGIAGAPYDIFIFDGNAAGAAGIGEMLVQLIEDGDYKTPKPETGFIKLLPCLPEEWKDGSFEGLCVKGGAEISAEWKDSQIKKASLKATADGLFRMQIPEGLTSTKINGKKVQLNLDEKHCVCVYLKKGDILEI